jgi:hypothetical protein
VEKLEVDHHSPYMLYGVGRNKLYLDVAMRQDFPSQ